MVLLIAEVRTGLTEERITITFCDGNVNAKFILFAVIVVNQCDDLLLASNIA